MDFFVPNIDGIGPMEHEDAEQAWTACRKGAEDDTGQEALKRRVYSLTYPRKGKAITSTVGELEPYYGRERVIAIIAFPAFYKVCCTVRGFLKVGDTPIVGASSVQSVTDFDS